MQGLPKMPLANMHILYCISKCHFNVYLLELFQKLFWHAGCLNFDQILLKFDLPSALMILNKLVWDKRTASDSVTTL